MEDSYSTQYYKFVDEDIPAVVPDERIEASWQDYREGHDPMMAWIPSYADEM